MPNFAIYVANSMTCFFSKEEAGFSGRAVEGADALDRKHGAQARPAAQGAQGRSLGAGEHPAPDQAAMRVVEGVAIGPAGCANAEAVLVEGLDDSRVGQGVVALERQPVITTACQDLFGDRGL